MSERLSDEELEELRQHSAAFLPSKAWHLLNRGITELLAAREVVEAAKVWRATTGHEASDHMLLNQRDARRALLDAIDALAGAK